jgi:hypothetical protein
MYNLYQFHKNRGFENKIDFLSLNDSKILFSDLTNSSVFWAQTLTSDFEMVYLDLNFFVFYSKKFNFYNAYFTSVNNSFIDLLKTKLSEFLEKGNFIHYILSDGSQRESIIEFLENHFEHKNFKYSLLNINSEVFYDTEPVNLNRLKKVSYVFAGGTMVSRSETVPSWFIENPNKFILDFKYPLTYFYHKFGFVYFQQGEQQLEVSNRMNKAFLYTKNAGTHTRRYISIQSALSTGKILEKQYSETDWFWYFANYNYYHMAFFTDYNLCKFNIVMETVEPANSTTKSNQFLSEKTLKAFMVSTPAYVLLPAVVYNHLKDYGFYFVNSEFGEYTNDDVIQNEKYKMYPKKWNENYHKFLQFLESSSDQEIDEFFIKCYEKSKKNKSLLENYLYSDKTKEIELLFKESW